MLSVSDEIEISPFDVANLPARFVRRDEGAELESIYAASRISVNNPELPALEFYALAIELGQMLGAELLYWTPANMLSRVQRISERLSDFSNGSALPVFDMLDFDLSQRDAITSRGLSVFCGQELRYSTHSLGGKEALRRMVRIAHDCIVFGIPIEDSELMGLDHSERVSATVSSDGLLVTLRSIFPVN